MPLTPSRDLVVLDDLPTGETRRLVANVQNPNAHPFWPTSEASSSHSSQFSTFTKRRKAAKIKVTLKMMLDRDRISFVSGSSMVSSEASLVLNTMRRKSGVTPAEREKYDKFLSSVEERLNIHSFSLRSTFTLDGLQNRILLKVDEHRAWDTYGAFALTPSLENHNQIQRILSAVNKRWNLENTPSRKFKDAEIKILTKSVNWVILLLRPWCFLPPNEVLWMSRLREVDEPSWDAIHVRTHRTERHYPYLLEDGIPMSGGHVFNTLRQQGEELSLFAMIMNAYSKARAAVKRGNLHEDVVKYHKELEATLRLIMYRPPPASSHESMDIDETPQPSPENPIMSAPFQTALGDPANMSHSSPNAPSLAVGSPGSNPGPGFGPLADPPEPILHNNLTQSEMESLLVQAGDNRISSEERLEAMLMLLCPPWYEDPPDDSDGDTHNYSDGDDGGESE